MSSNRSLVFAAFAGLLFGLGLAISQMTHPDKVLNFLDLFGRWDPSLALVMAAGLAVSLPGYRLVKRRGSALCGALQLPTKRGIDAPLLLGAAIFGIGWGLAGYCPGPAVANLGRFAAEALWFVPAMLLGSLLARPLQSR
jgi:uncharacterized protein